MVPSRSSLAAVRTPAFVFGLATSTALCATLALTSVTHASSFPSIAADSAAIVRVDSTHARGMADTVTILKPIVIDADRSLTPGRASATTVRLDRASLVRFQPSTPLSPIQFGLLLIGPLYGLVSLAINLGENIPAQRAVLEPAIVTALSD